MAMGRRRKRRRKINVTNVSAYVEECANEVFEQAEPADVPRFTYCYEIWGRLCIAAVLSEKASEIPLIAMDVIRKQAQKTYRQPIALVVYVGGPEWSWKKSEDRVVQLLTEHGGEAS